MTKVYLSDQTMAHHWMLLPEYREQAAILEARRILADVEQGMVTIGPRSYELVTRRADLADSLAAFLAASDPAAWLKERQALQTTPDPEKSRLRRLAMTECEACGRISWDAEVCYSCGGETFPRPFDPQTYGDGEYSSEYQNDRNG